MANGINRINPKLIRILLVAIVSIIIVMILVAVALPSEDSVEDFASCTKAGGDIREISPRQCVINGKTFTETIDDAESSDTYVGLSEEEANRKANQANVPHRVIERDGEQIPVTMDYVPGRLNFHVRDGEVYRVDIEGEEAGV